MSVWLRAARPVQAVGLLPAAVLLIVTGASCAQAAGPTAPTEQPAQRPGTEQQQPAASAASDAPHASVAGRTGWQPGPAPPDCRGACGHPACFNSAADASGVPAWIGVDEPPQWLNQALAAGGPLERHTNRPGAWYTVLYVDLPARWPVQLMLWQRTRSHEVRISALDYGGGTVGAVIPLPLWEDTTPTGRPIVYTSPFVLSQGSAAEGTCLLVEQWSSTGERPAPLWLQARRTPSRDPDPRRGAGHAWWQTGSGRAPPVAHGVIQGPSPSALLAPRDARSVIELPFQ